MRKNKILHLTVCAMLSAIGVVLLYLGSLVDVMDISMAAIASLCAIFAVIEYGKKYAYMVYGVTATLSLVLLPFPKSAAVIYTLFFGFYPILKETFEKRSRLVCWILKEVVFNASLALIFIALKLLVLLPNTLIELYIIAVVLCEVVFIVYDFALTRLISLYVYRIRSRIRIKK